MGHIGKKLNLGIIYFPLSIYLYSLNTPFIFFTNRYVVVPEYDEYNTNNDCRVQQIRPYGGPVWRQNFNSQGSFLVVPNARAIRAFHFKQIIAGRQFSIVYFTVVL